jgi:hypothetical protein
MDLNFESIELCFKFLRIEKETSKTLEYFREVSGINDYRAFVNGKKDTSAFESYPQVFKNKYGFINNLSVLDLIFNEGKFALDYLKAQTV